MTRLVLELIEVLAGGYAVGVLLFLLLGVLFHRGVSHMAREANASFLATLILLAIRWPTLPWHNREPDRG